MIVNKLRGKTKVILRQKIKFSDLEKYKSVLNIENIILLRSSNESKRTPAELISLASIFSDSSISMSFLINIYYFPMYTYLIDFITNINNEYAFLQLQLKKTDKL